MIERIDNRENVTVVPTETKTTFYTITELEQAQIAASVQQLTELGNILNTAMSAEGKMVRGFLGQLVSNFNKIHPVKREE